jgi:hypothetical protein
MRPPIEQDLDYQVRRLRAQVRRLQAEAIPHATAMVLAVATPVVLALPFIWDSSQAQNGESAAPVTGWGLISHARPDGVPAVPGFLHAIPILVLLSSAFSTAAVFKLERAGRWAAAVVAGVVAVCCLVGVGVASQTSSAIVSEDFAHAAAGLGVVVLLMVAWTGLGIWRVRSGDDPEPDLSAALR